MALLAFLYIIHPELNLCKVILGQDTGSTWRYFIFIDFVLDDPDDFELVIRKLTGVTTQLHILGRYRQGRFFN